MNTFLAKLYSVHFFTYSIIFTILTVPLVVMTIPDSTIDMKDYMNSIRILLLGIGGGLFGLLGFIIAGFTISYGKYYQIFDNFEREKRFGQILQNHIDEFNQLKLTYQYTVIWAFVGILTVFIIYIITCIPLNFNKILFITFSLCLIFTFYASIFSTFRFFVDGLNPINKYTNRTQNKINRYTKKQMKQQEGYEEDMIDLLK